MIGNKDTSPARIARLFLALAAPVLFWACRAAATHEHEAESPQLSHVLEAGEARVLDIRFASGNLVFTESELPQIKIEGTITVRTSDENSARLKAAQADLQINPGRFTLVTLREDEPGFAYNVDLQISVPKNLDLRAVLGTGNIDLELDLPARTDLQVTGDGTIHVAVDYATSAKIVAQSNNGDVVIRGFETQSGEIRKQLIYAEFNGSIGTQGAFSGKSLTVSVNAGSVDIEGRGGPEEAAALVSPSPAPAP